VSLYALERVETARLSCERLAPEHATEILALHNDPLIVPWLFPHRDPPDEAETVEFLRAKGGHWSAHGFGMWLLRDRDTGSMVGRGGLQHTHVDGHDEVEVGWAIVPDRWGRGLATELAQASLEAAFGPLRLPEIVAFTLPNNAASRRVMEKVMLAYERDIVHVGVPHVLYRRRAGGPGVTRLANPTTLMDIYGYERVAKGGSVRGV
jgi:RimJ/RimL family protein N-acetyltransferase